MNMEIYENITDLDLASAIVASGLTLESVDKTNPNKVAFLFERGERLDHIKEHYWKRQLTLEVMSFAEAQKYLKNLIYNQ